MQAEQDQTAEAGWLPQTLAMIVGLATRRPWLVLGLTLLSCVACGLYTCRHLTYLTHRNDLISNRKDYLKRWQQYVAEFGDDDDMVVVLRGKDRDALEKVIEELAAEIESRPALFERLFYKVDLRPLGNRALLFLPTDQIRAIHEHVQGMSLLLEPPVLGTFDPWFGWRSLGMQQLLRESERRLSAWKQGKPNVEAETFFRQLGSICTGASDYLVSHDRYRNPWRSVMPAGRDAGQQDQLTKPQYFFSADGTLAFLLTSPVREKGADSFTAGQHSIDALREILARHRQQHPEIDFGLTGLPVLENDEMIASQNDSNAASWLALAGVALLYLVVYRGFRYPLMTVAALVVGTIWALGWLTLTVGHLNILSSAFAVMLIGMGDYGVLWVTRFGQERQTGCDIAEAMRNTARQVGPSICTAAVTTAFAFFAAMLADLKAVAELGWIAGSGVLLCALSCFIVTPALLAIFDFRMRTDRPAQLLSLTDHREARRDWLPALMRRPGWVLALSGLTTLVLAGFACTIRYDHNLLNMQAPQMESVRWEKRLIESMTGSSWYAVSWTTTPEEAVALKEKFEQLPEVSAVVTIADLVPRQQERKLDLMRDLQYRLRKLPRRGETIEHTLPNLDDIGPTSQRLLAALTRLQREQPNEALAELQRGIEQFMARVSAAGDADLVRYQIKHYEELMTRDLADDLHRLRDASAPAPIQLEELPASLRERYVGRNGKWLVRIFSKDCLWNFDPLARFVAAVRTVDPESTGKPFTTLEGLKAMQNGFLWAAFYALMTMLVVLLIDFGNLKHTLVALLPLGMGLITTLGVMAILGIPLNPANMIALPLILGVGADNGVHVLHDFRGRDRSKRYRLTHVMGFGIMVAALTTILGFGTLMFAQHRGMASLGLFLAVGVGCCMLAALVFLPALLSVLGKRRRPAA